MRLYLAYKPFFTKTGTSLLQLLPKLNVTMGASSIQVLLFQHIKLLLPSHVAMVDAVADILNISNDSAYRRIRGEKPITPEEMQKLAAHYKISLDQFMHLQSDSFIFTGHLTNESDHPFEKWMQDTLQQLVLGISICITSPRIFQPCTILHYRNFGLLILRMEKISTSLRIT
ncbi:MAG: helix-turn-helix domain-containing protein [Bacteroidota bacterium]